MDPVLLPLKIGEFSLNLNYYRNAHFYKLNKAKREFSEKILPKITSLGSKKKIELLYVIYPKTKRKFDISNIGSIVDKFFSDTLVQAKIIPDDSYEFISRVIYEFGSVDPSNPRVEVFIKELV